MSIIGHNSGDNPKKDGKLIIDIADIDELIFKLGMIQQDIGVTETIIRMIENEQILDLQEAIREKRRIQDK